MSTKQTASRTPLKEYAGKRSERSKSVLSMRQAVREEQFQRLRTQIPTASQAGSNDEPWANVQVNDIETARTDFLTLLNDSLTAQMKALSRARAALRQKPDTYLMFSISSSPQILSFIQYHLSIHTNPILLQASLELAVLLANAVAEVVSALIDNKIAAAVHDLLLHWNEIDNFDMQIQILLFFTNLASSSALVHRMLCINLDLPSTALQMLGNYLVKPECTPKILKLCQILSVLLLHMSTTNGEWADILKMYAPIWIQAMHQLNEPAREATINLAFALMEISQLVETEKMDSLLPIFMNQGLLEGMRSCQYEERETITIGVICRLSCASDDYACKYLFSNRAVMEDIQSAVKSTISEIRIYAFNCLANICGINDPSVHDMLRREGYFTKIVTVIHLDIFQVKKFAYIAIGNILFYGNEDHRQWFCNQRLFLSDLVDHLSIRDTKFVEELLDIISSILEYVQGSKDTLVWLIFGQLDLESKLNEFALANRGSAGLSAAKILESYFDYELNDEDQDVEFEGSEGEEFMISKAWYPSPPGQQPISNYLSSSSGLRFAEDQVDVDMYEAGNPVRSICFGNYKF